MYNANNYFNNGRYNPYLAPYMQYTQPIIPQQQPIQQMAQQPMAQPVQYEIPISNIRYLNEKEMASYVLPLPNTKEMLIDKNSRLVCIKSTDQIGQSNAKYYKFEEIPEENQNKQNKGKTEPKIDMSAYASKDDLKSLTKEIGDKLASLEDKINGRTSDNKKS